MYARQSFLEIGGQVSACQMACWLKRHNICRLRDIGVSYVDNFELGLSKSITYALAFFIII